jgi:DinB superfamily
MAKRSTDLGEIDLLLRIIDQGYDTRSWHGPNLRGTLRGVTTDVAVFRPVPGRKNIWEHVVHAAYWKYVVRRRITGEKRGSFPLVGSNWFPRNDPDDAAGWRADLELLHQMHRSMRAAIAAMSLKDLSRAAARGQVDARALITGIAAHDVYHAGQIQLVKRLQWAS